MSEVRQLKDGYADIALAKNGGDAVKAYKEFHLMLEETKPGVDMVTSVAVKPDVLALKAIERVRSGQVYPEGGYFRGSGIIIVGDSDGEILAASYQDYEDPVAKHYGNYQYVALRKTGLAAMIGKLGIIPGFGNDNYMRIQRILEANELSQTHAPHHLGYAAVPPVGTSRFLTAGASGMLPTPAIAKQTSQQNLARFNTDRQNGVYKWVGDEAAGLHDTVAAYSVLLHLTRDEKQFPHDILRLYPRQIKNANVH